MNNFISVIIPTYNPDIDRLNQTIDGLKKQIVRRDNWEVILVDNNSPAGALTGVDLSWHPHSKIVVEPQQGLTHARLKGFAEAKGDVIVMVDDDNILDGDYLINALAILNIYPELGAAGGKSFPAFEADPPKWIHEFYGSLAIRDLGDEILISEWNHSYPAAAPIGAGMAIRKESLKAYLTKAASGQQLAGDRTGSNLSSGGDNEIVLEILKGGWKVGYFPSLTLQHLIPAARLKVPYLSKLVREINASWIKVLESHHINPWPKINKWTVPLRKSKAWVSYRVWEGEVNYIKWQGACGIFEGRSAIN